MTSFFAAMARRVHSIGPHHVIGALCLYFAILAAMGLHGSSIDMQAQQAYSSYAPLVGTSKGIRVDEWSTHTPSILNQVLRPEPFALRTSPVGAHNAALLYNIPAYSRLMLFRPQFWPFFILPLERAFPVYWEFKSLVLIAGVFLLLFVLTRNTLWSFLLSLFFYFSAHMQWAFSWPSLLPEMIGSATLAVALFCLSLTTQSRALMLLGSAAAAVFAANFALCVYPPHQIPIAWVCLVAFFGFAVTHRSQILQAELALWRLAGALIFCVILATSLYVFLIEARDAIVVAAHTTYPGSRRSSGGSVAFAAYLSDFLDFWKTQGNTARGLGNICEGTGFLWLGPLMVLFAPCLKPDIGRTLYFVFLSLFLALSIWVFLPVPSSVGQLFGLHLVDSGRMMPAMGLLNVLMFATFLNSYEHRPGSVLFVAAFAIATAVISYLVFDFAQSNLFLDLRIRQVIASAVFLTAVLVFIYTQQRIALGISLVLPLIVSFGLVNPISRGLSVITRSDLSAFLRDHSDLKRMKWIVLSPDVLSANYVVAHGVDVWNAFHVIPDLDRLKLLDPHGKFAPIYNSSGYLIAVGGAVNEPSFELVRTGISEVKLNLKRDDLQRLGVSVVASRDKLPVGENPILVSLNERSVDGFWIYRLNQ